MSFDINERVLEAIDEYHDRSETLQRYKFQGEYHLKKFLLEDIDDLLMLGVPIYDVLHRKYAAFSSLPEAIFNPKCLKGNKQYFEKLLWLPPQRMILLFYLFRLCGSGINYKPKKDGKPFGSHGFGNFFLIDALSRGETSAGAWMNILKDKDKIADTKGYILPQISYPGQKGGHLKRFIREEATNLAYDLHSFLITSTKRRTIMECVDKMNKHLVDRGFKRQTFVLSATMADIAEYLPDLIDPQSMIYAGTNAKRCIKAIFKKHKGVKNIDFESAAIRFLADRYGANPYDVEDSRLCDVVRYFKEYQSPHHIAANNGVTFKNNTILKRSMRPKEYQEFINTL